MLVRMFRKLFHWPLFLPNEKRLTLDESAKVKKSPKPQLSEKEREEIKKLKKKWHFSSQADALRGCIGSGDVRKRPDYRVSDDTIVIRNEKTGQLMRVPAGYSLFAD